MSEYFVENPQHFYRLGVKILFAKSRRIVDNDGDYILVENKVLLKNFYWSKKRSHLWDDLIIYCFFYKIKNFIEFHTLLSLTGTDGFWNFQTDFKFSFNKKCSTILEEVVFLCEKTCLD